MDSALLERALVLDDDEGNTGWNSDPDIAREWYCWECWGSGRDLFLFVEEEEEEEEDAVDVNADTKDDEGLRFWFGIEEGRFFFTCGFASALGIKDDDEDEDEELRLIFDRGLPGAEGFSSRFFSLDDSTSPFFRFRNTNKSGNKNRNKNKNSNRKN